MTRGVDQGVTRRWEKGDWGADHTPKRTDIQTAMDSLPTDRCGPPESTAGQAKIPQEAGEGETDAHTAEEVSVYENQGELRLGTACLL